MKKHFKYISDDLPASIVVFFVALPLCLGIALASGAPLFSGIIAGIVGGIIVGFASGSALGVSGPAAGLAVIVFSSITVLGSWPAFLLAVFLAGMLQLIMGYAKAGFVAFFFPSSVIKGMLTGIGLLIILKQIPHALGYEKNQEGALSDFQSDGNITISAIINAFDLITPGALFIAICSILILVLWDKVLLKRHRIFHFIQGPVVVIIFGILMNLIFKNEILSFTLGSDQVVNLPISSDYIAFFDNFTLPDFSEITNYQVWKIAVVIAVVASLETLLCVEATDKLDPKKRITPTNRELKAQGLGNMISGLIGGLPITQVIVRSSANIAFGAKSKMSAIIHGILLLVAVVSIAGMLNLIPLASLASILIMIGYKLAKPELFKQMFKLGMEQFNPFIATILGILSTDLLTGICIGIAFGIMHTLYHSYKNAYQYKDIVTTAEGHELHHITLAEEVSFFNKASIIRAFNAIPPNSHVIIDCTNSKSIAFDVAEIIQDFKINSIHRKIKVETISFIEPFSIK